MSIQTNLSSSRELEIIEYPGMVKNVDNMIQTLGGNTKISQVLGGEQKRLELRFHPDNPYNKASCGDENVSRAGLLLSVKVRRSKKDPKKPPQYQVRIVGHCNRVFTFDSLCDFQYLPLCKETGTDQQQQNKLTFVMDSIVPKSVTDNDYFLRPDPPLLCLPQQFTRSDTIQSNIFRNTDITLKEDGMQNVLGVLQKSTYDNRENVSFSMTDPLPTRADTQMLRRMKVKYVSDEQLEKVKKLFDVCPIWTRIALLYESGISNEKLRCILPSLAFLFSNGPWRTLYVRYGYDPRKDYNSRHYQTFDFRLRFRSGVGEFVPNRKDTIQKKRDSDYEQNELVQDIDYPYLLPTKLPRARQCIFRYCDIRIPKVQEMLDKIPSPMTGAMCNERTGWLPTGFDGQVREIVINTIKDLLRSHYRKEQINAELDDLEDQEEVEDDEAEDDTMDVNDSDGYDSAPVDVNEFLTESIEDILDDS